MDLEKLLAKAESMLDELESLRGKAKEEEDAEAREQALEAVKAKEQTYEALEAEIDAGIKAKERRGKIDRIKDDLETKPAGSVAPTVPAEPKDRAKEMREESQMFVRYMQGKALSDREREHMAPTSDSFDQGADGICIPRHLREAFLGKRWHWATTRGKALVSSGSGQGEENLVPEEYIARLLELPTEPTHILGMATVIPTDTGTVTLPRLVQTDANEYGGMSFEVISEGAEKPETEPEFEQIEITAYEIAGYTEISQRMLSRSAIDLEALLGRLYRSGVNDYLDSLFLTGTGVGQPTGIVNTAGIRTVNRAAANDVDYDDLVELKHAVLPHHRDAARFFIHDDVELNLEKDKDSQNRPLFSASTAAGPYDRLVGYPYNVTLRQPAIGSDGDVIFGDVREYAIATEEEIVVKRSEHYKFRENLIAFVVYCVMGGRLWQPRAMAILEGVSS